MRTAILLIAATLIVFRGTSASSQTSTSLSSVAPAFPLVTDVSWLPDGDFRIAVALDSDNFTVSILDSSFNTLSQVFPTVLPPSTTPSVSYYVKMIRWSPNGRYMAVNYGYSDDYVVVFDLLNSNQILLDDKVIFDMQWSNNSDLLAVSRESGLSLYETSDFSVPTVVMSSGRPDITAVSFSADGTLMAGSNSQGLMTVWQTTDGIKVLELNPENANYFSNQARIQAGAAFLTSPIWDEFENMLWFLNEDSRALMTWDIVNGQVIREVLPFDSTQFIKAGNLFLFFTGLRENRLYDLASRTVVGVYTVESDQFFGSVYVNPNNSTFVIFKAGKNIPFNTSLLAIGVESLITPTPTPYQSPTPALCDVYVGAGDTATLVSAMQAANSSGGLTTIYLSEGYYSVIICDPIAIADPRRV